ncbi:MAG: outer membrane beta-barrel protein [Bacteroidia bacterium]|nr:outer membrane beta-barrel protein [Bacteroidia bacterium]
MSSEQFERKLSARFAEAQVSPRPEVWQNIEKQLAGSKPRRGGFFWWFGDGVFAATLLWALLLPGADKGAGFTFVETACEPALEKEITLAAPTSLITQPAVESFSLQPSPREITQALEPQTVQLPPQSPEPIATRIIVPSVEESKISGEIKINELPSLHYLLLPEVKNADVSSASLPGLKIKRWAFYTKISPEWAFDMTPPALALVSSDQSSQKSFDYSSVESSFLSSGNQSSPGEILSVRFPRAQLHVSAGAEYFLSPKLSVQAGLGYSVSEYGIFQRGSLNSSVADQLANNPSGQLVITRSSFDFQPDEIFRIEQIELPVGVNYYLRRGRSSLVLSAGISFNRLVSRRTSSFEGNAADITQNFGRNTLFTLPTPDSELLVYRKYHVYASGGAVYQYQLRPGLAFFTGPQVKYQLSDVFAGSAAVDQLPYRLGWQVGFKFFPGR